MRQMDLTEGVIWKKLLVYAWPVVLSSLLQSAYAITDLIVAGWFIGKDGISAINNASQVMQILTQVILGITTGGNILMGGFLTAVERPKAAISISVGRGLAFQAMALLLLAAAVGGMGIWFAPVISEALCAVMAVWFLRRFLKKTAA